MNKTLVLAFAVSLVFIPSVTAQTTAEALGLTWTRVAYDSNPDVVGQGTADVSDDQVLIAWVDSSNDDVMVTSWDGSTFTTTTAHNGGAARNFVGPTVTYISGDKWVLHWIDTSTAPDSLYTRITTDNGVTWTDLDSRTFTNAYGAGGFETLQVFSVNNYAISATNAGVVSWTEDGGVTWTTTSCPTTGYVIGYDQTFDIIDGTGGETVHSSSNDACASDSGSTEAGPPCGGSTFYHYLSKASTLVIGCKNPSDAISGLYLWDNTDWEDAETARVITNDFGPDGTYASWASSPGTYFVNSRANAGSSCSLYGFLSVEAQTLEGCLDALGDGVFIGFVWDNTPYLLSDNLNDENYLWIGEEIEIPQELLEAEEFDRGLKSLLERLGFLTAQSRLWFTIMVTGVFLAGTAGASRFVSSGPWKNYLLMGVGFAVVVFCALLGYIDLWMIIISTMVGAFTIKGGSAFTNTYQEITDRINLSRFAADMEDEPMLGDEGDDSEPEGA